MLSITVTGLEENSEMNCYKIFLVEDDLFWIEEIKYHIEKSESLYLLGVARNEADMWSQKILLQECHLILMDINLDGNSPQGLLLARQLITNLNKIVILLTCIDHREIVIDAMSAGISDYFLKSDLKTLSSKIENVMTNTSLSSIMLSEYKLLRRQCAKASLLSPAENQIVTLRESGLSTREIANTLHKSERTIKNQFNKLYKRFGIERFDELHKFFYNWNPNDNKLL